MKKNNIEFIIDCPIDINIERTIGEGNDGFEREAVLQDVEDIKMLYEVCFKRYKYVLKVDRDIAIGNRIKFWLEINRIQYSSNLIIDLE